VPIDANLEFWKVHLESGATSYGIYVLYVLSQIEGPGQYVPENDRALDHDSRTDTLHACDLCQQSLDAYIISKRQDKESFRVTFHSSMNTVLTSTNLTARK
jgi:hypothetical protein